ncbi:MAG: hypothetical protein LLF96_11495 [Eubacteriales bacterium]|nr:hypothetical protein [Eubacteriales bacterium]
MAVMKAEEDFILLSPGRKNRRIWIDLYETNLTDDVIEALLSHLQKIDEKVFRLCLVGCSLLKREKIARKMTRKKMDMAKQIRFFSDPEKAKQWLVRE